MKFTSVRLTKKLKKVTPPPPKHEPPVISSPLKIIASTTTMPDRINLIRPTLESVLNQTYPVAFIEINVPYKCVRTGQDYVLPEWLINMERVLIYRTEDYGAITKVAPTLIRHENDYIWSFDDDINYNPNLLNRLVEKNNGKNIICWSGGRFNIHGYVGNPRLEEKVTILEGFGSVLYPPEVIKDDFQDYVEITSSNQDCKLSDDVVLSNYFTKYNIQIIRPLRYDLQYCRPFHYYKDQHATHLQSGGHNNRYLRVLEYLKSINKYYLKNIPSSIRPLPKKVRLWA